MDQKEIESHRLDAFESAHTGQIEIPHRQDSPIRCNPSVLHHWLVLCNCMDREYMSAPTITSVRGSMVREVDATKEA